MELHFISLASGSSGNCYYLGTSTYGILIDAGIGIRAIKKGLKSFNIPITSIKALFITHDHADHIKAAGVLGEIHHIPVYTTALIHQGINKSYCTTERLYSSVRLIEKEIPTIIEGFTVTAFEVPHDGIDNVGYFVEFDGKTFTIATDVGHPTDIIASYIKRSNHLVLESNYDEEMLKMSVYPQFLKDRIGSGTGHLSNKQAASMLMESFHENLKTIFLCHLSKENNHPELAYKTIELEFRTFGIIPGKDFDLVVLKRLIPSDRYIF